MKESKRFLLPRSRRLSCDVVHLSSKVPLCAQDRVCRFSELSLLRSLPAVRVSWPVMFIKAFALVAREVPELRQIYLRWPFAHVYQHGQSVAALSVHREFRGEPWLFWGLFPDPTSNTLGELQWLLDRFKHGPVETVYKKQFQLSALPVFIRRLVWWLYLNVSPPKRMRRCGTYFASTISGLGAEIQSPPSFHTCNLTYGPIDIDGRCRVTIAYDHRLMDGVLIADVLQRLEETLNGAIADELRGLIKASGPAAVTDRAA